MTSRVRYGVPVVVALVLSLLSATAALAHHPERTRGGGELFPGEGIAAAGDKLQHGGSDDHLPPKKQNVALIGKAEVSQQGGSSARGRVADVAAHGNYAYLTAFRTDDCLGGGAWIVDISDPTSPVESGFLPTTDGSYAGEGAQVIDVEHGPYAGRQLFLHQNETCDAATGRSRRGKAGT
jgi:hypothetical protein